MKPYEPVKLPLDCIDWADHVAQIGQANASLGRYDGMVQSIVNSLVLLSPLTTQEAVLSSRIEGTQASMEEVLGYEAAPGGTLEPSKREDIQEIINYRKAMGQAVESLESRPLCLNMMKELHKTLMRGVRGRDKAPGEFRRSQNHIGQAGCRIEDASFVPPSPERVEPAMHNWEIYLHYVEKDRLIQMAVAKAQFELIHPFLDGNGRIGRMLVPLFLFEKRMLSKPVFYLSAYLEAHRDIYYERLQAISRQGDWNGWIRFFLTAVIEQAHANTEKTKEILGLYERMKQEIPKIIRSQYGTQAIDSLFYRPIFLSTDFISRSQIPKGSAIRILNELKKSGLIRDIRPGKGRQAAVMIFPELIAITKK
jgi:Fic family protein